MLLDFLRLDRTASTPLYLQLYQILREAVEQGHIFAGERLPSVRRLAQDLEISRTTVEAAYQQLCVEGYLGSRPQSGYYVQEARRRKIQPAPEQEKECPKPFSAFRFNFGTDVVDVGAFQIRLWQRYLKEYLHNQEVIASYGEHQGEPELREALAEYTHSVRGVIASESRIVVGAGTQPLLYLLAGWFRQLGAQIAMEQPGFPQALQVLQDCGLKVCLLPGDQDGISLEALEHSGARILYLSPSNRQQTGTPIPMTRRLALLEWARSHNGRILEDDYNGELRYTTRPIPAMQGLDSDGTIIYLGSFSKLLLPSVRIGYMVLPPDFAEEYHQKAWGYNQTASKIEQLALARFIREGHLERQLRKLRKLYAIKGNLLLDCLHQEFGSCLSAVLQETALRVTVTPKNGWSSDRLVQEAAKMGVRVMPFGDKTDQVALGFAGIPAEDIPSGVSLLGRCWKPCLIPKKGL